MDQLNSTTHQHLSFEERVIIQLKLRENFP